MPNGRQAETRPSISLNYSTMISLIGYASCVASLIALFVFSDTRIGPDDVFWGKIILAVVLAVGLLFFYLLADQLATKRGEVLTVAIAGCGFVAYAAGALLPESLCVGRMVCSCLAMAGLSAHATFWFADLCVNPRRHSHAYVAASVGVGLLICVGECFFPYEIRVVATVVIWCVSIILAILQCRSHLKSMEEPVHLDAKKADARSRIQTESVIMLAVINAQFGFLIGSVRIDPGIILPCMLLVAVVACITLALDALGNRQRISEESIYPLTIPLTVTAFVGMYLFGDGAGHLVALCILTVVVTLYIISGLVALNKHVILAGLSPIRTYARARSLDYCATAGGIALGIAASWAYEVGQVQSIQVTVGIAVAYVFVASFFHKSRFPDSTVKSDGSVGFAPAQEKGQWKRRCKEVSERFKLSDRQYEVLCLIGQGRNAEYVANTLTISVSTVQTHIRNIYQKLGVHSRQELLDLIENTKLYGED